MQIIYPSTSSAMYNAVFTATGAPNIVSAGSNAQGIVVYNTRISWVLGAAASIIVVNLSCGATLFHGAFDDNGAGGVVNIPAEAFHQNPTQLLAANALVASVTITGTARVTIACNYRIL